MKKYIALFICVSFMCIFMLSCGNAANTDTDSNTGTNANAANENETDAADNSAGTASNADIFGAISEIVGNLTTINLAVMPETGMPVQMSRPAGGFNVSNIDPSSLPDGVTINDDGSISVNGEAIGQGGNVVNFGDGQMPEGFAPGNFDPANMPEGFVMRSDGGGVGQRSTDENGEPITRERTTDENGNPVRGGGLSMNIGGMLLDYTGEEKEFIIPVGLPIYAVTRGDDGNQVETEIQLTDIKTGNVISITYKADGKTVEKILVSQITALSPSETEAMREQISERMNTETTTAEGE